MMTQPTFTGPARAGRSRVTSGLGAAAAAGSAHAVATAPAHAEELRIATLAPSGSAWMKILKRGAQEASKATSGRVVFKYYPNGVKGDERAVVRLMNSGQLEAAAVTSVGLAMIEPSIRVLEFPRMFDSVEELDYVRNKMWPHFKDKFAKRGFHLGQPGDVGWIYFFSQTPVKSVADLRTTKVWQWSDDDLARTMFKKLNVNGIPLGVPNVLSSLTTGRINACYGSPLSTLALQWYTKVKYMTSMPMSYSIGATVIRVEAWNKLSEADRATINGVMEMQATKLRKTVRRDNKKAQKSMTQSGVQVVDTPPAMIRDFDTAAKAVWDDLARQLGGKDELAEVLKHRAAFRKK